MKIQLENVNENSIRKFKWKFNLKMEIKVYLEIGKKVYENNGNWEVTKIEECGWKKTVCKTARRAHNQKIGSKNSYTGTIIQKCRVKKV